MKIIKEVEGIPDYASIIELINAEWPDEFGEKTDAGKIADMIESHMPGRDRTKFLYDEDRVIGFYRWSYWPREARETDTAHTYDIAVLPSLQQQGLGTMLMLDMIDDCRRSGMRRLLSRTFLSNRASIGLHLRTGFREHMRTADSIVWELSLS